MKDTELASGQIPSRSVGDRGPENGSGRRGT